MKYAAVECVDRWRSKEVAEFVARLMPAGRWWIKEISPGEYGIYTKIPRGGPAMRILRRAHLYTLREIER